MLKSRGCLGQYILTIYACIAEDFETVKQIYYKNCLKSRELHQCKDRQFYTMTENTPHSPIYKVIYVKFPFCSPNKKFVCVDRGGSVLFNIIV